MKNSGFLLIPVVIVLAFIFVSAPGQATLADCPACKGEQPDWTENAIAFLEGKPVQDTPSTLSGPQQARLLNAQIDARKKASQASNDALDATARPMPSSAEPLGIDLYDIRALPNPANINDEVKIIAVFRNASPNSIAQYNLSKAMDLTHLTVNASIFNSNGLDVGMINLRPSSENEYSGLWNASVESGIYNATINVSGTDGSKTFKDALQVKVVGMS